jgi:hypothetical protein
MTQDARGVDASGTNGTVGREGMEDRTQRRIWVGGQVGTHRTRLHEHELGLRRWPLPIVGRITDALRSDDDSDDDDLSPAGIVHVQKT